MATDNPVLPDYSHLGIDIIVQPDLDENEQLAVEVVCLFQDLINGITQTTGIADGTTEGAEWGVNLMANLGRGFTIGSLFALKVAIEAQWERDDRVSRADVGITVPGDGRMLVFGTVYAGERPYPFSFTCTNSTVSNLYVNNFPTSVS